MILDEVYSIAYKRKDKIKIKDKEYPITPLIVRECRMIVKLHALLIGVGTVFGVIVASSFGIYNAFFDIIVVILMLLFLNILLDRLAYFLLKRRVK